MTDDDRPEAVPAFYVPSDGPPPELVKGPHVPGGKARVVLLPHMLDGSDQPTIEIGPLDDAIEPPIVRHDPFEYMRGARWMNRKLSPQARAARRLQEELEAFPVLEGREPNTADIDAMAKRVVDGMVPIFRREQLTDMAYDILEEKRQARIAENRPKLVAGPSDLDADVGNRNDMTLEGEEGRVEGLVGGAGEDPAANFPASPSRRRSHTSEPDPTNGSSLTKDLSKSYNRHHPDYHFFEFKEPLCQMSTPGCTPDAAYAALRRFAVPGDRDAGLTVKEGDVRTARYLDIPGGEVDVRLEPGTRTLINKTRIGHVFHDGIVQRQIVVEGDTVYVRHYGVGNNPSPPSAILNNTAAPTIFRESIEQMRSALRPPVELPGKWPTVKSP
jgi:hypothetical protein